MADIRKRTGKKGVTYQVRYPNKATKSGYSFATFKTRKEALAFTHNSGDWKTHQSEIEDVGTAVDLWLKACEKEGLNGGEPVTKYTLSNYRYRADIITKYNWDKSLPDLTPPDIVNFRSWLLTGGYSRDLSRKVLFTLKSILKEMVIRGHMRTNIAQGIGIKDESRYREPLTIPSKSDVAEMLKAADRLSQSSNRQIAKAWCKYRPMLYLAVDSGMRPQEYLALSVSSITDNGVLVERALEGSGEELSVTKTPAGRRHIELSDKTLRILNTYIEDQYIDNHHNLLFPNNAGNFQERRNWQRRGFNTACKEAALVEEVSVDNVCKLVPKYRPYDLRHFFASVLIQNMHTKNISLKKIQYLMGHEKIETTLNVYGHLLDDDLKPSKSGGGILEDIF